MEMNACSALFASRTNGRSTTALSIMRDSTRTRALLAQAVFGLAEQRPPWSSSAAGAQSEQARQVRPTMHRKKVLAPAPECFSWPPSPVARSPVARPSLGGEARNSG